MTYNLGIAQTQLEIDVKNVADVIDGFAAPISYQVTGW